ncbi:MAG: hypothetical protein ACP5IZ_10325 [Thermoprotei archaeon]
MFNEGNYYLTVFFIEQSLQFYLKYIFQYIGLFFNKKFNYKIIQPINEDR